MPTLISSYARGLKVADIQTSRNVTIVQLSGIDPNFPDLIPFSIAHQKGYVIIKEVIESGRVPELAAENLSDELILILDGEVLLGAKQNRTINTSVLLAPKSTTVIPVSCVEQGRWSYRSRHFSPSEDFISPEMRSRKVASVHENLKRSARYHSNQQEVWNTVSSRIAFANVRSESSNFQDYVSSQKKMMEDVTNDFKKYKDATGIVGFINGKIIGCDIIPQPYIFGLVFERLVRSYSLDAAYLKMVDYPSVDYNEQIEKLFLSLDNSKEEKYPSPGVGDSVRISGESITGSALIYQMALIHLAVFSLNKQYETL